MGPFQEFNIFIGANNAGNSSVLNFISRFLPLRSDGKATLNRLDSYRGGTSGAIEVEIGLPKDTFQTVVQTKCTLAQNTIPLLARVCDALADRDGNIWLKTPIPHVNNKLELSSVDPVRNVLTENEWYQLWNSMMKMTGGSFQQHWLPESLNRIAAAQSVALPDTKLIPAMRKIGPKSQILDD